ncbi:MAG: hypothetical protein Kow0031_38760 [Anaerolineae bacterium]
MACTTTTKQAARVGRAVGIPATAGRVAFESGVAVARAARAGWRAQRFVDKTLLDSPIPTSFGLLAMAGGAGGSLSLSALQAMARLQQLYRARQRRNHEFHEWHEFVL